MADNLFMGAAALAALIAPSYADEAYTLQCGQSGVEIGDPGTDPVTSTYVAFDVSNQQWRILHTTASGKQYAREQQYRIEDGTAQFQKLNPSYAAGWIGTRSDRPNLVMHGVFGVDPSSKTPRYDEWLFDRNLPPTVPGGVGKMVMHSAAYCTTTHQPDSFVAARPAPAPRYQAPETRPDPPGEDSVGIVSDSHSALVKVILGNIETYMAIDTGASVMSVQQHIAEALLRAGYAAPESDGVVTLADGTTRTTRRIIITDVRIGSHLVHGVVAGVAPDEGTNLLPFPVLNMMGKFTIDTVNSKIIFGS